MESTVSTTKVGRTGGDAVEVIHDRERNRKRREIAKMAKDLDVREEALFMAIGTKWMPVSELAAKVAGGRAWNAPDGGPISGP